MILERRKTQKTILIHTSVFYIIYNLKCTEALETQVFLIYEKAFSLSRYFPCILFFLYGLMMASIESHNVQPPYLLVNKLSQLTYILMGFFFNSAEIKKNMQF